MKLKFKMNNFKLVQFNCRGFSNKSFELMELAEKEKFTIICLNEVKRYKNAYISPNYNLVSNTEDSRTHGSLIFVQKGVEVLEVQPPHVANGPNGTVLEILRIKVRVNENTSVWITNVYKSPDMEINLDLIFDESLSNQILVGDFNSPHEIFNCNYENASGKKLVDFLDTSTILTLLNNGQKTHENGNMLDLHICSQDILNHFCSFSTYDQFGSDHYITASNFNFRVKEFFEIKGRVDITQFKRNCLLKYKSSGLWSPTMIRASDLDEKSRIFVKIIQNAAKQSEQPTKICTKTLSRQTIDLISQRKKLRRKIRNESRLDVKLRMKKNLNFLGKQISKSIVESELSIRQRKINAVVRNNDCDRNFWSTVKFLANNEKTKKRQRSINYLGKTASNDYEKSNMFAQMLQNTMVHSKPKDDRDRLKTHQVDTAVEAFINKKQIPRSRPYIVTRSEIDRHLARFSASAPGPDKVTYKILKNLPVCVKSYLALIITSSINNGVVPSNWKDTNVTMIPKPEKDPSLANSYRPISLTNCIAKLAEACVKERLVAFCEERNIFGDTQSAYRSGRSSTDNLLALSQYVAEGFQWSEVTGLVCLDVEKAFDSVWRCGLILRMKQLKIDNRIIFWVSSFLTQRNITVRVNAMYSASFDTIAGVPQGSVIAPILFLIYVSRPPITETKLSQFADDFGLYYRSTSPLMLQQKLQHSLDTLAAWCNKLKIKINPQKTKFMIFKSNGSRKAKIELTIEGQKIEQVDRIKFLGLTYFENLTWNKHVDQLFAKATSRISQLKRLRNLGFSSKQLLTFYKMRIRPIFTYANAAWITASPTTVSKLQTLQNRAIRVCLDQPMWCNVEFLHSIAKVPYLKDLQLQLSRRYIERVIQNKNPICDIINNQRLCSKRKTITPLSVLTPH